MAGSKYKKNIYLDFFLKIVGAKILHWKELLPIASRQKNRRSMNPKYVKVNGGFEI